MTNDINSLESIAVFLEARGYEVTQDDDAVITRIGNFPTVFTITDIGNDGTPDVRITTQLTTLGQIPETRVPAFLTAALDVNTRILPFAVATITASDNPDLDDPSNFPVVLTDSLPVGDISEDELQAALDSLLQAILGTRELLEVGFGSLEVSPEPTRIRRSQLGRAQLLRIADEVGLGLDDLLGLLIAAEIFFLGEESVIEDPMGSESVEASVETTSEEVPSGSEPAPVVEDDDSIRSSGSYDYGDSSSGSYDYDDGGSDFGSDD